VRRWRSLALRRGRWWLGASAAFSLPVAVGCGGDKSDQDDDGGTGGGSSGSFGKGGAGGSAVAGASAKAGAGTGGALTGGVGGAAGLGPSAGASGRADAGGGGSPNAGNGGSAGGGTSGAAGGTSSDPLPDGSREVEHVVNLVNAEAVAEVEGLLRGEPQAGLPAGAHEFYDYYLDEYDFLILIVDHTVDSAVAAAAFEPVYRPARASTGDNRPTDRRLTHGSERLMGVIGGQYSGSSPPLEHELSHFWAAHLDAMFGFGKDSEQSYESHWGMTSVHGQLGGFDETSMQCVVPVGAVPPNCTAESNGNFQYSFDPFYPYVNRTVDYAPLELYLMGLIPASDVPERFLLLEDSAFSQAALDSATNRLTLEASGTSDIVFSDILDFHGVRPLATEAEKHLTAAFIVVSAAPASDEVMATVAGWQETFGNYAPEIGVFHSFESRTGGRATLATRLGRRRTAADPEPNPPMPSACSLTEQDCPDGLACYGSMMHECSVPGTLPEGATCVQNVDCIPGYACPNSLKACAPYCDPFDATAEKACAACPNGYTQLVDDSDALVGGYCKL